MFCLFVCIRSSHKNLNTTDNATDLSLWRRVSVHNGLSNFSNIWGSVREHRLKVKGTFSFSNPEQVIHHIVQGLNTPIPASPLRCVTWFSQRQKHIRALIWLDIRLLGFLWFSAVQKIVQDLGTGSWAFFVVYPKKLRSFCSNFNPSSAFQINYDDVPLCGEGLHFRCLSNCLCLHSRGLPNLNAIHWTRNVQRNGQSWGHSYSFQFSSCFKLFRVRRHIDLRMCIPSRGSRFHVSSNRNQRSRNEGKYTLTLQHSQIHSVCRRTPELCSTKSGRRKNWICFSSQWISVFIVLTCSAFSAEFLFQALFLNFSGLLTASLKLHMMLLINDRLVTMFNGQRRCRRSYKYGQLQITRPHVAILTQRGEFSQDSVVRVEVYPYWYVWAFWLVWPLAGVLISVYDSHLSAFLSVIYFGGYTVLCSQSRNGLSGKLWWNKFESRTESKHRIDF